ncbi:TPA: glycosyltransferase, partial [Bacillus cereus]
MKSLTVIILYSEREQILEESIQSIWKLNPLEIIILVP